VNEVREIARAVKNWDEHKRVFESALFMAPGSLQLSDLMNLVELKDKRIALRMLGELAAEYSNREGGVEIGAGADGVFQMRVKPHHLEKVKHLAMKSEMHKGLQRTLALIAVKQPIRQSLVIKYRNNKAYDHVKSLVEQGFVERTPSGRTYLLSTTKKFSEVFGEVKLRE